MLKINLSTEELTPMTGEGSWSSLSRHAVFSPTVASAVGSATVKLADVIRIL